MKILFLQKKDIFKKSFIILSVILFSVLLPFSTLHSAINKQINYQGKLTNGSGVAVPDGTYNMEFVLYTAATGDTDIWTETRISTDKVQVTSGIFSVLLGEVTALTGVDFNQTLYLGVNIGATGSPGWDGEMTPRKKIGSVPSSVLSEGALNIIGGNSTTLLGSIPYQSDTNITTLLSPNTTTTKKFLRMTGNGTNGAVPAWDTLVDGDIPSALTGKTYNGLTITNNGTNTLNIAAGQTLTVTTGGTLGSAAYTNSTAYEVPLTFSSGLTRATNTITNDLITGKTGGQTIIGGTAVGDYLTYKSTTGAGTTSGVAHQFVGGTDGATTAMTILNNGNVGIGTTSPGAKLDVYGGHVYIRGGSLYTNVVESYTGGSTPLTLGNGTYNVVLATGTGNVGIGTTSPGAKLEVSGNIALSSSGNTLRFSNDANEKIRLYSNTYGLGIGTGLLNYVAASGAHAFYVGGTVAAPTTEVMRITNLGNVGIGTTAPTALLNLKAGTTTANTAPLKFTSGNLMTAPEAGAIEFLTDAYYGTITTGTARKQFAFTDSDITGTATKATNLVGGNSTTLLGSIPYQSNTDTTTLLAPNTTTTKKFLRMTGSGTNGAAPAWDTLVDGDIPSALTGKTYNGLTITNNGTNTLNIAAGKTLTVSNSLTLAGTDSTTMTFPSTSATIARTDAGQTFTGVNTMTSPVFNTSISTPSIITASGALGITPASGSNLNVTLATTGDFAVNTSQFYVDTSATKVGINTANPATTLDVQGSLTANYTTIDETVPFVFSRTASSGDWLKNIDLGGGLYSNSASSGSSALSKYMKWDITDNRWEATNTSSIIWPSYLVFGYDKTGFYQGNTKELTAGDPLTLTPLLMMFENKVGVGTASPQSLFDIQGPTGTGATGAGILTLATKELTIIDGDELGRINFNSPLESDGSDSILAGASIWAEADDTFSTTVNSTELVFGTATTSAAIERMRIDSAGNVGIGTSTPVTKLDVNGAIAATQLQNLAGTNLLSITSQSVETTIDMMEYSSDATANAAWVSNALVLGTGGTITSYSTYTVHTFTTSGTFNPGSLVSSVDVLVVAGGGGGGAGNGGGGGGGGVISSTGKGVTAGQNYTVTVGNGGNGGATGSIRGASGNNSVFSDLTAVGGGGGGASAGSSPPYINGLSGGSGGGGGAGWGAGTGGSGTSGQGYAGGNGYDAESLGRGGGGGGGAGEAGTNGSYNADADGGDGVSNSIRTGSGVYYGGGGGGSYSSGEGGLGGGGYGGAGAIAGTANTGGGGGGGDDDGNGDGGSGIVVIRYTTPSASSASLSDYSESTIKNQGSYALKGIALITTSLNKTLTKTTSLDLTGKTTIKFDIRSTRTGSNIKIGIHDTGGTTTETTPNVTSANTYQTVTWDISGVSDANKNTIDSIIVTIVNADAENTFYLDNMYALTSSSSIYDTTFTTNSIERLRINNSGNIGVGETVPGSKLSVLGGVAIGDSSYTITASPTGGAIIQGNVGIGTSAPATKLEIGSSDLGDGVAGPVITLGRNTNATNTGAGSINFLKKGGTAGYVWQDAAGNMRINTSAPSNANDTAGTVIGAQTSLRETKQDIADYSDYSDALKLITGAPLHTFRYIKEVEGYGIDSPLAKTRIGFIADEVSPQFMVGNVIDQVTIDGLLMASIKELNLKIENLSNKEIPINSSENTFGEYTSLFFNEIIKKVENGIAFMKNLAVETLRVGSPDKRTGITLYDETSGDPYCFSISNGTTKTILGECTIISPSLAEENPDSNDLVYSPKDIDAPIITLDGDSLISLDIGSSYEEKGAFTMDETEGEVAVIINGVVDTNVTGIYTITYSAKDTNGNEATPVTRTIKVGEELIPIPIPTETTPIDSTIEPETTSTQEPEIIAPAPAEPAIEEPTATPNS